MRGTTRFELETRGGDRELIWTNFQQARQEHLSGLLKHSGAYIPALRCSSISHGKVDFLLRAMSSGTQHADMQATTPCTFSHAPRTSRITLKSTRLFTGAPYIQHHFRSSLRSVPSLPLPPRRLSRFYARDPCGEP